MKKQPENACLGCRGCCQVYSIGAIPKLIGYMCKHATETGCGIYDKGRPKACRKYKCVWLKKWQNEPGLHPEVLGVVCDDFRRPHYSVNGMVRICILTEYKSGALVKNEVQALAKRILQSERRVAVVLRKVFNPQFIVDSVECSTSVTSEERAKIEKRFLT